MVEIPIGDLNDIALLVDGYDDDSAHSEALGLPVFRVRDAGVLLWDEEDEDLIA